VGQVSVRVLNQETAGVLSRVKRGEEIEVTERGTVIARIVPAEPSPAAPLVAAGKLRPPKIAGPMPRPKGPVRDDEEAGELLRRMRDDERY
jgi:prevent-host-death family protein